MKRIIGLIVIAVLGFYVAWPAWSGYRIATALGNQDEEALASKVDFAAVRESLRPTAAAEIDKLVDKQAGGLGPLSQAIGGDLKKQMLGKVVDQVMAVVVTPRAIIRIANEGGDIAASVEKAMSEAAGQASGAGAGANGGGGAAGMGGLGGVLGQVMGAAGAGRGLGGLGGTASGEPKVATEATKPATAPTTGAKKSFGFGNIKGLSLAGPLGFNIAVARDAAQAKPDATIGMSFTGGDWKLTRVVPNL